MADEAFALRLGDRAFAQDVHPWVARSASAPGCRRLAESRVVLLRHRGAAPAARQAVEALHLRWPATTGELHRDGDGDGESTLVVRRNPEELLLLSEEPAAAAALLAALPPGRHGDAVAIELSHGTLVLALEGPRLDLWLSHLVDAAAIPRQRGSAARTRLVDVPVLLLHLEEDEMLLLADRALAPYLADWLAFTHEAAFARPAPAPT